MPICILITCYSERQDSYLALIFPFRTSVAGAFLLNPETGVKVPVTSNDRITYNIKINNSTKPSGYRIEVRWHFYVSLFFMKILKPCIWYISTETIITIYYGTSFCHSFNNSLVNYIENHIFDCFKTFYYFPYVKSYFLYNLLNKACEVQSSFLSSVLWLEWARVGWHYLQHWHNRGIWWPQENGVSLQEDSLCCVSVVNYVIFSTMNYKGNAHIS